MIHFMLWLVGLLGIAYFIGGKAYQMYQKFENNTIVKLPFRFGSLIIGVLLICVSLFFVDIGGQEVGVVKTPGGIRESVLHTGWHIVGPWNTVYDMDKTVQVYTFSEKHGEGQKKEADAIWAPTKDGIKMGFDVTISWCIVADSAWWIYANVSGSDSPDGRFIWIEENIIRPKAKSVFALSTSQYSPTELYSTKRDELQKKTFDGLGSECQPFKIRIVNVDVREVFYNREYEEAINNKKLAEQEALRLIEVTRQREELKKQEAINKDIAILTAEGQARALQIKGNSISSNPKIIQLEWVNKWNGQLPTYMMGSGQGVIIDLGNMGKGK